MLVILRQPSQRRRAKIHLALEFLGLCNFKKKKKSLSTSRHARWLSFPHNPPQASTNQPHLLIRDPFRRNRPPVTFSLVISLHLCLEGCALGRLLNRRHLTQDVMWGTTTERPHSDCSCLSKPGSVLTQMSTPLLPSLTTHPPHTGSGARWEWTPNSGTWDFPRSRNVFPRSRCAIYCFCALCLVAAEDLFLRYLFIQINYFQGIDEAKHMFNCKWLILFEKRVTNPSKTSHIA